MPSNSVTINNSSDLDWEVPDSKIDAVIGVLDAVGFRVKGRDSEGGVVVEDNNDPKSA